MTVCTTLALFAALLTAASTAPCQGPPKPTPAPTAVHQEPEPKPAGQGVEGQVVDPTGAPVADAAVYLMETSTTDLLRQLMRADEASPVAPVARARTDDEGRFELRLDEVDPSKHYEVRIVSDRFVDHTVPALTLEAGQWHDCGSIRLQRGATVSGQVTIEGLHEQPVPNAKVMVRVNGRLPVVHPTPGRKDGLVVACDASGCYRVENAPPGVVTVSAVASGYARVDHENVAVDASKPTEVDFQLATGGVVTGFVRDAQGQPITGARVEAKRVGDGQPVTGRALCDGDGRFLIVGLVDAPHSVSAVAPGFVRSVIQPVPPSGKDITIVLEKQGAARLRVYDPTGEVVHRFEVTPRFFIRGQSQLGNTNVPTQQPRVDPKTGIACIEGLDPNRYVLQVEAPGACKTFSEPFEITAGGDEPLVEVHLTVGGSIEGQVVDVHGVPVRGMTVTTMPNHVDDNPFTKMFAPLIPYKITRAQTTTDLQGRYQLTLLTPGPYQLVFRADDFSDLHIKDIEVRDGKTTTVPITVAERGALVHGTVTVGGAPAAQVKVSLSAVRDPTQPAGLAVDAITDKDGHFAFQERIPAGHWLVMAARQTLDNPLLQIADYHETQQEITIEPGQEDYTLSITIPK